MRPNTSLCCLRSQGRSRSKATGEAPSQLAADEDEDDDTGVAPTVPARPRRGCCGPRLLVDAVVVVVVVVVLLLPLLLPPRRSLALRLWLARPRTMRRAKLRSPEASASSLSESKSKTETRGGEDGSCSGVGRRGGSGAGTTSDA